LPLAATVARMHVMEGSRIGLRRRMIYNKHMKEIAHAQVGREKFCKMSVLQVVRREISCLSRHKTFMKI
jgi:hypothetical protein